NAGESRNIPLNIASLPNGDYTLQFRLTIGGKEVDRIDSPVRVLDPLLTRQPDQKIRIVNGAFSAGGRHVFLRGVNYWPRFIAGIDPGAFNGQSWLEAGQYDPDLVEADLTEIAALHFSLVNIQFSDFEGFWVQEGRALIDFLERCRSHGIWVQVSLRTTLTNAAYAGQISPTLESYLQAAYLPGNDRVFAYELLWEPMIGTHSTGGQGRLVNGALVYNTGRLVLDPDWRAWVNDQYGSLAAAQEIWGFTAPIDGNGQLTNPLDDQMGNDGPWRIMVAAYRRFLDDYLGRNLGVIAPGAKGWARGGETILLVEDQEAVRKFAKAVLNGYGYKVIEASQGAEALILGEEHRGEIHLLLTDVVLPEISGKDLSERMKELRPSLKVLFTSGYTTDVINPTGVLEPGVDYLPKPFSRDGLAAKVREVLARSS
ncbi:MAG: response regulator, partial [Acidobacteriia bacterium]|nr:response regulator [Terriglobia bacterium]